MSLQTDTVSDIARKLTAQKERIVEAAITHALGVGWTMQDVQSKVEFQIKRGSNEVRANEVLLVNGKPLVIFYPVKFDITDNTAHASLDYKLFY